MTITQDYTVVGLYPDSSWGQGMREATFVEFGKGDTAEEAIDAILEAVAAQSDLDVDELEVLALFKGHHMDMSYSTLVGWISNDVVAQPERDVYQNELVDRVAPRWAWEIIDQSLAIDRKSIACDPALRKVIGEAIDAMIEACEEDRP